MMRKGVLVAGAVLVFAFGCSSSDSVFGGSSSATSSTSSGMSCVPGTSIFCTCVNGASGAQTCKADGSGFGSCTCVGGSGGGGSGGAGAGGSGGAAVCPPQSTAACYDGPPGTEGKGLCVAGITTCSDDGSAWGPCIGEITPHPETCSTPGDDDCDGVPNEGGPDCACPPGSQASCYSGPPATKDVGPCHAGTQLCKADGTGYGPCVGEIVPALETCNTPVDDDCDGLMNEQGAGCVCLPGSATSCYDGPQGTEGVGVCKGGTKTCNGQGTAYGPCVGEITPSPDVCATAADEDCNGSPMPCVVATTWSKDFGLSAQIDIPHGMAVDASGNVVLAASVPADYGGGPLGPDPEVIVKFDALGNYVWGKSVPGVIAALAVDTGGNIFATGSFNGTADFGGGPLTSSAPNQSAMFVVKFGSNGAHVWSKAFGDYQASGKSVAADVNGDVLVAGGFQGSINLGGAPFSSNGPNPFVLAKLDASGGHVWSKAFDEGVSVFVVADPAGNALVAGTFFGPTDLGGGVLPNNANNNVFAAKFAAASGAHLWSQGFGDAAAQVVAAPATDAQGDLILTGQLQGSIDFGGGPLASAGGGDIYLAKLGPDGAHLWSKRFGDASNQFGLGVATDAAGDVLATGTFSGTVDFGGAPLVAGGAATSMALYVTKLDASGAHIWSKAFGDGQGQSGMFIAADPVGSIFLAGDNGGSVDFGNGLLTAKGYGDVLLAKLAP